MANESQSEEIKFAIVDGPEKFELMLALFDNSSLPKLRTVQFWYERDDLMSAQSPRQSVDVCINGVERESGDGESWLFHGFSMNPSQRVHGYFSTKVRTGLITLVRQKVKLVHPNDVKPST